MLIDDGTSVDLVPLKQFSQRLSEGWEMVPGYELKPGDYAVVMRPPGFRAPLSNLSRAAAQSCKVRGEKQWAKARKRLETA